MSVRSARLLGGGLVLLGRARGPGLRTPAAGPEPAARRGYRRAAVVRGRDRRGRPRLRPRRRPGRPATSCRRSSAPAPPCSTSTATAGSTSTCSTTAARTRRPPTACTAEARRHASRTSATAPGLDFAGYSMGVAVGDVNNDGRPDVLVTQYGGVRLFLNNGDGTFTDVTEAVRAGQQPAWGTLGRLLRLRPRRLARPRRRQLRRLRPAPAVHDRQRRARLLPPAGVPRHGRRKLFRNLGRGPDGRPGVRFEDVTRQGGPRPAGRPGPGRGLRRLRRRRLAGHLRRQRRRAQPPVDQPAGRHLPGGGGATAASPTTAWASARRTWASPLGDVDGDGLFDLFVTHLTERDATPCGSRGRGGRFRDRTGAGGLRHARLARHRVRHRPGATSTTTAGLDLAVVNGRVVRGTPAAEDAARPVLEPVRRAQPAVRQRRRRAGSATSPPANPPLCGTPNVARGLACGRPRRRRRPSTCS